MPYIPTEARVELEYRDAGTAGELNYEITRLIQGYFIENGGRYQQINDVLGALEGAKAEFYRRIVAPYEDKKIAENGDVLYV